MLLFDFGEASSPFKLAKKISRLNGVEATIKGTKVKIVSGAECILKNVHGIKTITNYSSPDSFSTDVHPEKKFLEEDTNETEPTSTNEVRDNLFKLDYLKPGMLLMVDFIGDGRELDGPHPAIYWGRLLNGTAQVIPCTSKYKDALSVLPINLTADNLLDADSDFLRRSRNITTYVLTELCQPVDVSKVISILGTLSSETIEAVKNTFAEIKMRPNETGTQPPITMEDLKLTQKQVFMIENIGEKDLLEVANSSGTYEQKLEKLLLLSKITKVEEERYNLFFNLCKNTRAKSYIDIDIESVELSKSKFTMLPPYKITSVLVDVAKKRFRELHPCLIEFVTLLNKLANPRRLR